MHSSLSYKCSRLKYLVLQSPDLFCNIVAAEVYASVQAINAVKRARINLLQSGAAEDRIRRPDRG
jgi:hypothetical protein